MKKIIFTLAMGLLVAAGFSSCDKESASKATPEDVALGDTVATSLGNFAGAQAAMSFIQMRESGDSARIAKMKKADFLRGLKQVLSADTNNLAYYEGLSMGLQLVNPVMGLSNEGIPVDAKAVIKAFEETFNQDTVADMGTYYSNYQDAMHKVQVAIKARQEAKLTEAPQAQANLKDGEAYAEKMVKEGYQKSETGLVYKIENAGEGAKPKDNDLVTLAYTGKLIDGKVFDSNENATFRPDQVVPGFGEALKMLGKGGKMVAVIPANLAYGVHAPESIGPNQTLVFDIEVKDIKDPAAK